MCSFNKIIKEYTNKIIAYHGSTGNTDFNLEIKKGIWFVSDIKAAIFSYYGKRGKILKCTLDLKNTIDLTMYDVDEKITEYEFEEFLIDMNFETNKVQKYIDYFFYEDYYEPETAEDEATITLSNALNHIIEYDLIPNNLYDSLSINESSDETYCIFNKSCILDIEVVNV